MENLDPNRVRSFFDAVVREFSVEDMPASIITTHMLKDRPYFLSAVSKLSKIISLTPKPKSIDRETLAWLRHRYPIDALTRADLERPSVVEQILSRLEGEEVVFIDVGGYYSDALSRVERAKKTKILGVIEDTENGHQRYAAIRNLKTPVISVARSPLKNPEDFLVGQAIVFSAEALLREQGDILQGKRATVIGYGKLGRSIANFLRARSVEVVIFDVDPLKIVEALSHGFNISSNMEHALKRSGLVFCATGNVSLRTEDYAVLPDGCYVATATSSDDELQTQGLLDTYKRRRVSDFISRFSSQSKSFYLLNHGQAVNFVHGAVVGPFIYLIQAEILASISVLKTKTCKPSVQENDDDLRRKIARLWLKDFSDVYDKYSYSI